MTKKENKRTEEHCKNISISKKRISDFIKTHGKFPSIPDLCQCKEHCGTIVYNGSKYALGHNLIGSDRTWQIGRKLPEEHVKNLILSHLGNYPSDETRKKMQEAASGSKNPFFGHKHTEEFKESRRGKKNPRYGKTPSHGKKYPYDSPLQGRIYLNNSWEVNYVQYLDKNKILWLYEMETFELSGEKCYTPDFFLPKYEKFVEIKGWMRQKDIENINDFNNEYLWKLEVLRKKDLQNLGIKLGAKYINKID